MLKMKGNWLKKCYLKTLLEFTGNDLAAVSLIDNIMTEEFEKPGDEQATNSLINTIMAQESEQTGNNSATLQEYIYQAYRDSMMTT